MIRLISKEIKIVSQPETLPDALAIIRRHYQQVAPAGEFTIEYDGLILRVNPKPGWNMEKLP